MGKSEPEKEAEGGSEGTKKHRLEEESDGKTKKLKTEGDNKADNEQVEGSEEDDSDGDESDDELDIGESDDDEDMEEEGDLPDNLVMDFEGVPPNANDVAAVDALVGQVFRGLPVSSLEISKLIVDAEFLSTLLKDQDLEDPSTYGVCSVLNLSHPGQGPSAEFALKFRDMVLQGLESHYEREQIDQDVPEVLQNFEISTEKAPNTMIGLVVIEKLVNLPSQVVWQLFTTLKEDMEYENQQFTHFMLMTKFYRVEDEVFPVEEYYETFQAVSNVTIDFPLPKDVDTIPHNGNAGMPFRRLLIIPAPAFYQVVNTAAASL